MALIENLHRIYHRSFCTILILFASISTGVRAQEEPQLVVAQKAEKIAIKEELNLTGSVVSPRFALISSETDGIVESIAVEEGDYVDAGALLVRLDPTLISLDVRVSESLLARAEAERDEAVRKHQEALRLSSDSVVAETQVRSLKAQWTMAEADLERRKVELELAKEWHKRHEIRAPFSGIIFQKSTEPGQWIQKGDPAVTLVAMDPVWIEFQIPQMHFNKVNRETPVSIRLDAVEGRTFNSRVSSIIAVGNRQARTFTIRASLPNPDRSIAPGMSTRVELDLTGPNNQAVAVSRDALVRKADGSTLVWRINDLNKGLGSVEPLNVSPGRFQDLKVEILQSDLKDGDWIVVRGNESLEPGQRVKMISP